MNRERKIRIEIGIGFAVVILLYLLFLSFSSGHVKTEFLYGSFFRLKLCHYFTLVHNEYPIGKTHYLIKLKGYEKYCLSVVTLVNKLTVNSLYCAYVKTSCRLNRNK